MASKRPGARRLAGKCDRHDPGVQSRGSSRTQMRLTADPTHRAHAAAAADPAHDACNRLD
jgi:hypothetical protein